MKAYVDRSGKEFSIHQLEQLDIELILEAIVHYGNDITNNGSQAMKSNCKPRLVHLKDRIEDAITNN